MKEARERDDALRIWGLCEQRRREACEACRRRERELRALVETQASDPWLWGGSATHKEELLKVALLRLHAAITREWG